MSSYSTEHPASQIIVPYTKAVQNSAQKPMIIKAFTESCPHCKIMKPIYEHVAQKLQNQYLFTEFDASQHRELTKHFNITRVPTFICIKDNKEVGRLEGSMSEKKLEDSIHLKLR